MTHITELIDSLYDSWLGKFKALRQFFSVLRAINLEIQVIRELREEDLERLQSSIRDLRTANEDLQEQVKHLQAPTDKRHEGFTSARTVMDKFYESQQGTK